MIICNSHQRIASSPHVGKRYAPVLTNRITGKTRVTLYDDFPTATAARNYGQRVAERFMALQEGPGLKAFAVDVVKGGDVSS